jgi:PKD repeat protein
MCADTATQTITIYPKVDANFTSSVTEGCSPLPIFFQNLSSQNASYKWDFGDNFTSQEIDPLHVFLNNNAKDSSYTVSLTSTSIYGCMDSVKKAVLVYPKLIANFSASDTVGYSPLNIQFTNNTNDNNATYYWIFGDGGNSSVTSPSHEFLNNSSSPLQYEVLLYATNEINCKDTANRTIRVKPRASAIHPQISVHEGISLYPIPAGNEVTIEYTLENPANVIIELFSADGKLINSKSEYKLSGKNKDILELNGINGKAFLVKLRYNDKIQTIKGIKE